MIASVASYRLQCNAEFELDQVRELVPYLERLGVNHLYLAPIFAARPGSPHGYDVIDPTRISPELGGKPAFDAFARVLADRAPGLVLDIVPNHMLASSDNPWWADVLANGRESPYAGYFDIDWSAGDGKLVLPVLGRSLRDVLDAHELRIDGAWLLYHDHAFPLRPGTDTSGVERALAQQHYVLAHWRDQQLNYRRFFEVNHLVCVRQEDAAVFDATHSLVRELVRSDGVSTLRVDHIDGLHDPARYLDRLATLAPGVDLIVEKILSGDELLPDEWPVAGTTGYEFLNALNGLFVDSAGLDRLRGDYQSFTGRPQSFPDTVFESKRQVARELFAPELRRLVRDLASLAPPELSSDDLEDALVAVAAAFPVYRTYVSGPDVSSRDRDIIQRALTDARARAGTSPAIDALERVLLLDVPEAQRDARVSFVMRWQQFTGPLAAKGLEDTALYRYNALLSMNDVGADPAGPAAVSPDAFHEFNRRRQQRSPRTMNATSTHDTKRGEDVRARLNVLSELHDEWSAQQRQWSDLTGDLKADVDGELASSPNNETLIYQTLVGAWPSDERDLPSFRERLDAYLIKATREAKERTSWIAPNDAYERALTGFARTLFDSEPFLDAFLPFQRRIAERGVTNSLAQVVLKVASPGVPDVYQGSELWDLSLVDPDNRRPVDFAHRVALLDDISSPEPDAQRVGEWLAAWPDGRIKLHVLRQCLDVRRANPALFLGGDYLPLAVTGAHADRVVAFARHLDDAWAIAVVPRLVANLTYPPTGDVWQDTAVQLPPGAPARWRNALTGEAVQAAPHALPLATALAHLPVALLRAM